MRIRDGRRWLREMEIVQYAAMLAELGRASKAEAKTLTIASRIVEEHLMELEQEAARCEQG